MATLQQNSSFAQQVRAAIQKKNGAFGGSSVVHAQALQIARHIAARSSEQAALEAIANASSLTALVDHLQTLRPKPIPVAAHADPLTEPAQGTETQSAGPATTHNSQSASQSSRPSMESILVALVENLPQYEHFRVQVMRVLSAEIERSRGDATKIQQAIHDAVHAVGIQELLVRVNRRRDPRWALSYEFHPAALNEEEVHFLRRFLDLKPKEIEQFIQGVEKTRRKVADRLDRLAYLHPTLERGVQYADVLKKRWGLDGSGLRGDLELSLLLNCSSGNAKARLLEALFVCTDIARWVDWREDAKRISEIPRPDIEQVNAILRGEIPAQAPAASVPIQAPGKTTVPGQADSAKDKPFSREKILRALLLDPSKPRNLPQIRAAIAELKLRGIIDELRKSSDTPFPIRKALRILELCYLSRKSICGYLAVARVYSAENPGREKVNTSQVQRLEMSGLLFLQGYIESV